MIGKNAISQELPHVSVLRSADEGLYEKFFQTDSIIAPFSYGNSWAYICQAARDNPYKYFDGKTLLTITSSSNPKNPIRIVRPIGENTVDTIATFCNSLRSNTNRSILLCKLRHEDYISLKYRGFEDPVWNLASLEHLPDDIYPQPICTLNNYFKRGEISLEGRKLAKLRGKIARVKSYTDEFKLHPLSPMNTGDAKHVIKTWKSSFVKRYSKRSIILPKESGYYSDPYTNIITRFSTRIDNERYFSLVCYANNIPVGFSFLGRISDIAVAQYVNVCGNFYKGLSEYLALSTFLLAFRAGYEYVNMGGSETETLFKYNQKFAPERYEKDYYLIF